MNNFPKDELAENICYSWAEDFKAMGMMNNFSVWQAAGFAFESGASVHDSFIITKIKRSIKIRIESSKLSAVLPNSVAKALLEITREAKYLDMLMTHTFG
jgi:ABC-type uncharacterized transport system permease subunit